MQSNALILGSVFSFPFLLLLYYLSYLLRTSDAFGIDMNFKGNYLAVSSKVYRNLQTIFIWVPCIWSWEYICIQEPICSFQENLLQKRSDTHREKKWDQSIHAEASDMFEGQPFTEDINTVCLSLVPLCEFVYSFLLICAIICLIKILKKRKNCFVTE